MNELVAQFGKYVVSIAKNYQGKGLELCSLISSGMYGLVSIISNPNAFDTEGTSKFVTYANAVLSRYMREALDEYNNVVRLPKNIRNDMRWVREISNELESLGFSEEEVNKEVKAEAIKRCPDISEYALERLYTYTDYGRYTSYSVDHTPVEDEGGTVDPLDLIDHHVNEAPDQLNKQDLKTQVRVMLQNNLTQREQDVIDYYFFDGLVSLEYIKQTYNITNAERVRQIRDIALSKLRELDLKTIKLLLY